MSSKGAPSRRHSFATRERTQTAPPSSRKTSRFSKWKKLSFTVGEKPEKVKQKYEEEKRRFERQDSEELPCNVEDLKVKMKKKMCFIYIFFSVYLGIAFQCNVLQTK